MWTPSPFRSCGPRRFRRGAREISDERKPNPQSRMCTRDVARLLAEPVEYVRQELGAIPSPSSVMLNHGVAPFDDEAGIDVTSTGRELERVREQVPQTCCRRPGSADTTASEPA